MGEAWGSSDSDREDETQEQCHRRRKKRSYRVVHTRRRAGSLEEITLIFHTVLHCLFSHATRTAVHVLPLSCRVSLPRLLSFGILLWGVLQVTTPYLQHPPHTWEVGLWPLFYLSPLWDCHPPHSQMPHNVQTENHCCEPERYSKPQSNWSHVYMYITISLVGQHHGIVVVFCGCKSPAEHLFGTEFVASHTKQAHFSFYCWADGVCSNANFGVLCIVVWHCCIHEDHCN